MIRGAVGNGVQDAYRVAQSGSNLRVRQAFCGSGLGLTGGQRQDWAVGRQSDLHTAGLLSYFIHRKTNAGAEGLNSRIQAIKVSAPRLPQPRTL